MYEIGNDKMFDNELNDSTKLKIEKHVSLYNSNIHESYQRYPKTDNFHLNVVYGLYACREEEDYFYESYFKLNCLPEFLEKITYLNKYDRFLVFQTESSWNKNLQIAKIAITDVTRSAFIKKVDDETNIIDKFNNLNYEDSLKLYYKLYPKNVKKLQKTNK